MYIVVVGAGAMGSLFGGLLKEAGHDVVLVDVWQQHIDAINAHGLRIDVGDTVKTIGIPARRAEEVTKPAELIILFTKTTHAEKALADAKGLIGGNTYILTLQNGLGNVERIAKYVPIERIIVGVTNVPSGLIGPGHVCRKGEGKTAILSADGKIRPELETIQKYLKDAGLHGEISQDLFKAVWEKVAFNAAMNSLGAVTRLTDGVRGIVPEARTLAMSIVREVVAVANRKGIPAEADAVIASMENAFEHHFNHLPSMLQDVLAKRLTEVEAINGAVVKEAALLGMSAPVTESLYLLVRVIEQTYEQQISPGLTT